MGSCIQLHLSKIWCISVNSLALANLYRSSLLRLERDNENRRTCPLNKSEKNQQNAELFSSPYYLFFLRQMITREDILNWCLTVIDVFVIIILSVAYYCKYKLCGYIILYKSSFMANKYYKLATLSHFRLYSILWRAEPKRQISERAAKAEPAQPNERPFSISAQVFQ